MVIVATADDLEALKPMALKFAAQAGHFEGFDWAERFVPFWTALLESGKGVILYLCDGDQVVGSLGGLAFDEPYTGRPVALEFWWYVEETHRRGGGGEDLLNEFERWAAHMGCEETRLAFLTNSMPEVVKRIYEKRGYAPIEILYKKVL